MNQITTVVVTHNRLSLLQECIDAIRAQSRKADVIIVVNNGSNDGTKEWLDNQYDLQTIHQGNSGGSAGFYTGIKAAYEKGADYIWVMDDDAIPDHTCLKNLSYVFDAIPEISFAASLVFSQNGYKTNVPQIDFRIDKLTQYPDWQKYIENGFIKIKQTTFVSLLISATSIKEVGYPIKEFFIWGDDYEYTNRLSDFKPGYLVSNSHVIHKSNRLPPILALENDPLRIDWYYYATRNHVYLLRKQRKGFRKMVGVFILFLSILDHLNQPYQIKKTKVFLKGFVKGLFFNPQIEKSN